MASDLSQFVQANQAAKEGEQQLTILPFKTSAFDISEPPKVSAQTV